MYVDPPSYPVRTLVGVAADPRYRPRRERSGSYQHSLVAAPSPTPPPPTSGADSLLAGPSRTPYRPGFQPKGVSRSQTEAFVCARLGREERREGRRGEERRLGRRLDKLIALHFTPPSVVAQAKEREDGHATGIPNQEQGGGKRPGGLKEGHRRESSLVEELLVDGRSPRDVWKTFKERSFSGGAPVAGADADGGKGKGRMTTEQKRGASACHSVNVGGSDRASRD